MQPLPMTMTPVIVPTNRPTDKKPVIGIDPMYIVSYPMDLVISDELFSISVTDSNGNIIFKNKSKFFSLRGRRVLLGLNDLPIVTFQKKIWTMPRRWQVFRGESTDPKDLLFSMKKSSIIQIYTKLEVFLASNTKETTCDFMVSGSRFQSSWTIKLGDTNTIIAQVHKKQTAASIIIDKNTFNVTVYPFVDYAFMVTLVAILQQIVAD